jgi:hypothetical protein
MNYIKHLTGFFSRIALENSINPTHISLYLTLFQSWNVNRFKNPITISRDEMMKGSKIASKATYHKCIKELQRLKFLDYHPSYNPYSGTQVFMINFSELNNLSQSIQTPTSSNNNPTVPIFEPAQSKNELLNGKLSEHVSEPLYIYNNKQTLINNTNIDIDTNFENLNEDLFLENENTDKEKKLREKKKEIVFSSSVSSRAQSREENPSIDLVKEYFRFQNSTEFEAERFYNYYSSIGWLIGGKTKMKDWQASARNWMLNTSKFSVNIPTTSSQKEKPQLSAYNLNTTTDKNYAEPL